MSRFTAPIRNMAPTRQPRIWFLGRKVGVSDGKRDLAKAALEIARKKKGGARSNGMLK